MADWFTAIDDDSKAFIERQHMFFVATAPSDGGHVNVSPKGSTLVRILGPNLVGWLDYPGSGNETAAHTSENGRITVMFCSFDKRPGIVRLYGTGRAVDLVDPQFVKHREAFRSDAHPYVRQAFFADIDSVQTSCGYAVPLMDYVDERMTLDLHCERKKQPREMVDGLPTAGPLLPKVIG